MNKQITTNNPSNRKTIDKNLLFSFVFFGLSSIAIPSTSLALEVDHPSVLRQNMQLQQNAWKTTNQKNQEKSLRQQSIIKTPKIVGQTVADTGCLKWQSMHLQGLELLSTKEQKTVMSSVPQKCLSVAKLNELSRVVSDVFLKKGYFRIRIKQSNGKNDQLVWDIAPLQVSEIKNNTKMSTKTLFPGVEGKAINIRKLDQGLDQANRLNSRNVTMDVYPDQKGGLVVEVVDQPKKPYYGAVEWNYNGQTSTGRARVQAVAGIDNLLGLADSLSVYAGSTSAMNNDRYNRYAGASFSIPYGYWLFTLSASSGTYRSDVLLPQSQLKAKRDGSSWQVGLRADRVISRGAGHISTAYGRLSRVSVTNRFMDQKLAIGSYNLSSASLGLTHTALTGLGVFYLDGQYTQGLSIFGADKKGETVAINPHFKKMALSADWTHEHSWKNRAFRFQHSLVAQHAWDSLPGVEEMGLTDASSVRGFRDTSLGADSGIYLRQTVSVPLLVKNRLLLKPYLGFDFGRGQYLDSSWVGAVGGTLGLAMQLNNWTVDVAAEAGRVNTDEPIDKTSTEVRAKLNYRF